MKQKKPKKFMQLFTKTKLKYIVVLLLIGVLAMSLADNKNDLPDFHSLKPDLPILYIDRPVAPTPQIQEYFDYYSLNYPSCDHYFGTFDSAGYRLAAHIFKPPNPKATVVIAYGYLNHSYQLQRITDHLLAEGFAVAFFDLPGHGLSTGTPGDINDFSSYSQILEDFTILLKPHLSGPYHFIGFSTGSAIMVDYLLTDRPDCFDEVILTAPLIRSQYWNLSKFGHNVSKPFLTKTKRVFRNNTSDKEFLKFIKNKDPLQGKDVPLNWVNSMYKWNEKIKELDTCQKPITIIQGRNDQTVDFEYNMNFIEEKFPNVKIHYIEDCDHELLNELPPIRDRIYNIIDKTFKK
jgi:alpha-beta hydrolase superfamily lysophospholipase